jgi:hypothetical protein
MWSPETTIKTGRYLKSQTSRERKLKFFKMNSIKTITSLVLLVTMTIFSSCKKEGPAGPAGEDGNANVVSSTITSSSWAYTAPSWAISFTYPAITQDIINSGAVLVYIKVGNNYSQLPLTFYQSASYSSTIEVSTFVGGLSLFWTDSDLTQPNNPGSQTFKVVVIAASGLIQNPNVDYSNYEEVKSTFNIVD